MKGEDLATSHWEDARHWLSVYSDLIRFKHVLIARIQRDLERMGPASREAAAQDLAIITDQLEGYQERVDLWYRRVWELRGLWVDSDDQTVRHQGREVRLTKREFQLLEYLLDHPHRFFTADHLKNQAWSGSALFPDEVRNYVRRLRKILAQLEVPCDLVNRPQRGYSLVFRDDA